MNIFVTGATGYLGSHLCEYLKNEGHNVTAFIRNPKKAKLLESSSIPYKVGDIREYQSIVDAVNPDTDLVINCAGFIGDRGSWKPYREVNVMGAVNLAEAMRSLNIKRLIHISSIAAYGVVTLDADENITKKRPRWFKYGVSKQDAENRLLNFSDLDLTILRPGHIVGKRDRIGYIPVLYHSIRKAGRWINNGNTILPLVYLGDVLSAINIAITNSDTINDDYNLVADERKTIKDVVGILHEELNLSFPTKNIGFKRAYYMGWVFEALSILGFKAPMTRMGVVLAGKSSHFSSEKIKKLGWGQSKSVKEMVTEWAEWRKEFEESRR